MGSCVFLDSEFVFVCACIQATKVLLTFIQTKAQLLYSIFFTAPGTGFFFVCSIHCSQDWFFIHSFFWSLLRWWYQFILFSVFFESDILTFQIRLSIQYHTHWLVHILFEVLLLLLLFKYTTWKLKFFFHNLIQSFIPQAYFSE